MTNNIKLQTLLRFYKYELVVLYDLQYNIREQYTKKEILANNQLCKMKVVSFYTHYKLLVVNVVE